MHRTLTAGLTWLLLLAVAVAAAPQSSYDPAIQQWRRDQDAALRADDGWLSVVGLFWLKAGANRAGADPSNDIALPKGLAPARVGVFQFAGGQTTFTAEDGVPALVNGRKALGAVRLRPDEDRVVVGDLTMFVIARGERTGIRLLNKNSEARRAFTGRAWYPVKPSLRIVARFVPYNPPKQIPIVNVLGDTSLVPSPGYVEFTIEGKVFRLDPTAESGASELFFNFRDLTSRADTYPAGRYLYSSLPTKAGTVDLDFNRAVSPPCAFTAFATCPLAPKQNDLAVRIDAGEKGRRTQVGRVRAVPQRPGIGEAVQTPFGKGVVRAMRNNGRLLVDVDGRALVVPEAEVSVLEARRRKATAAPSKSDNSTVPLRTRRQAPGAGTEVDLHGLTVEEALGRVEHALNEALLADFAELRFIHGRTGGRIRAALHRRLRDIPSVRGFRLDPRNDGVTIVRL